MLIRWFTNLVYFLAGIVYLPLLLYQMAALKKNRRGWAQRFGRIELAAPGGPRVWVHAVSLGEVNAARLVVEKLSASIAPGDVVISTTTDTGFARAVQLFGPHRVFRYPLDFSWIIGKALDRIQAKMIVLVELEVWPNLVAAAKQRAIPVAVINGRLTERSCRRLSRFSWFTRRMFATLDWVGAQDETIAERFRSVGVAAERITVTGSVKWDTVTLADRVESQEALARAMGYQPPLRLWVCGSTGEDRLSDEESLLLEVYRRLQSSTPHVHLVIVPRKPERFDSVARLIRSEGFDVIRRSERPDGTQAPAVSLPNSSVSLGDTMGELRKFYALADVVFVGRSFVGLGGSDPMEVAALGKPMICGPCMNNFEEPVARLKEQRAIIEVTSRDGNVIASMASHIQRLLADAEEVRGMGRRAQQVVRTQQGATDRVTAELVSMLNARK